MNLRVQFTGIEYAVGRSFDFFTITTTVSSSAMVLRGATRFHILRGHTSDIPGHRQLEQDESVVAPLHTPDESIHSGT